MDSLARLVVIQDGGLRAKTPLFDSQSRVARDAHHTPAELASFIFGGSGMTMSEHSVSVKIHYLPALPAMAASILVSRLFSIDPSFQTKHQQDHLAKNWNPEPILDGDDIPSNDSIATRFTIAVVLPISDSFVSLRDTITENWLQISNSLLMLETIVIAKLKSIHLTSNLRLRKHKSQHFQSAQQPHQFMLPRQSVNDVTVPLPSNCNSSNSMKRMNFTKYSLQSEIDIHHAFGTFSKMIISLTKTPRLYYNLKYSNQTLINWATNLSAWVALKDAVNQNQTQTHFLVFMLTILLPMKEKLFLDPLSSDQTDVIRLVIGTGNPVISEKLIFILSGLLGYERYAKLYDQLNDLLELSSPPNSNDSNNYSTKFSKFAINETNDHVNYEYNEIPHPVMSLGDDKLHSSSEPIPFKRAQSPSYFGMTGKFSMNSTMISPSPNSRGWSPSLSQSYKNIDSDHLSIKSGLGVVTPSTEIPSPQPSNNDVTHSMSIPIRGVNSVNAETIGGTHDAPSFPSIQRSSSYASLQNISASYGTNTPTSSLGASGSWRNVGSWIDRWRWNPTTNSPRQNSGSVLGSSLGRTMVSSGPNSKQMDDNISGTPSPRFGPHGEGDWDETFDSVYFATSKRNPSLAVSPTKSDYSNDSSNRSKSNPVGSFGFGVNYKCEGPDVHIERSIGNLKTITYEKLTKSIQNFVDEIMDLDINDDDFKIETQNSGVGVMDLSYPQSKSLRYQMDTISSTTIIRLPMLVGYIPEYHGEYTLMACPVSNPSVTNGITGPTVGSSMLESTIVKSLRDDVTHSKKRSRLWLVNVGMRWVKLFETNSIDDKPEVVHKPVRPSLNMRSLSSSGGLDMSRSYNERKSNLTSYLQRMEPLYSEEESEIPVSQKMIFSSNSFRPDDSSASEASLDLVNDILIKITTCIDSFITDMNHMNMKDYVDVIKLEQRCCDDIRSLIQHLLSSF